MTSSADELRELARKQLKKKADFRSLVFVWFFVTAIVSGVWFFTTPGGYFWPAWVMFGVGIAVIASWWEAYGPRKSITEADIDAEVERLKDKP